MLAYQSAAAEQVLTRPLSTPVPAFDPATIENGVNVAFKVNGATKKVLVDSRMTLLDTPTRTTGTDGHQKRL